MWQQHELCLSIGNFLPLISSLRSLDQFLRIKVSLEDYQVQGTEKMVEF